MREISPTELAQRMAAAREAAAQVQQEGTNTAPEHAMPLVLDLREEWELQKAALPDVRHLPMSQILSRVGELDPKQPIICMCHHGGRSTQVGLWLETLGFTDVSNLTGGIEAWSLQVDDAVPRY